MNIFYLPEIVYKHVQEGVSAVVGGPVRAYFEKKKPSDIDVYYFDNIAYKQAIKNLKATEIFHTDYITIYVVNGYKYPIELIFEPRKKSVEDCIKFAEFDICAGCYSKGKFIFTHGFRQAILKKHMRFLRTNYPEITKERLLKYSTYGYSISDEDVHRILYLCKNKENKA